MGLKCKLIFLFIILLAVSPAFALGDRNMNMLLFGAMGVSPLIFLWQPIFVCKIDIPLVFLCLSMICFPVLFHPETVRWSTMLYSCMFCIYFMAFVRLLHTSHFINEDFLYLLKGLLYAYCIVLMIQQFCVLTGLPIFNVSNYSPLEPWKLNSLAAEPSHSARIISILMLFYIQTKERILGESYVWRKHFKDDRMVWFAFLWSVLTMGSATVFIFLLIIVLKLFPRLKNPQSVVAIVLVFCAVALLGDGNKNLARAIDFTRAVVTLDERQVIKADGSGAHRIVQSFRGAKFVNLKDRDDWLGHGVDADQRLVPNFQPSLPGSAGMFFLWVNYGFLVCLLWWGFSFYVVFQKETPWISFLIWFLTVLIMGGLNNQIIWLLLAVSYVYKVLGKAGSVYNHDVV